GAIAVVLDFMDPFRTTRGPVCRLWETGFEECGQYALARAGNLLGIGRRDGSRLDDLRPAGVVFAEFPDRRKLLGRAPAHRRRGFFLGNVRLALAPPEL